MPTSVCLLRNEDLMNPSSSRKYPPHIPLTKRRRKMREKKGHHVPGLWVNLRNLFCIPHLRPYDMNNIIAIVINSREKKD